MPGKLSAEIAHFNHQTHNFRILVLTNLVYALVLPVIDIFVAAYVMRSSNDPTKVVIYQLTIYTGIPLTFLLNGWLLKHVNIRKLYSVGMMLSGVSMMVMMSLHTLDLMGIGVAGIIMGMSFGFYWANRDYLALAITHDGNRNYYYGLETFFYTIIAVVIPVIIGWFIEGKGSDAHARHAYRIITGVVFFITIGASVVCFRGTFENPVQKQYIFFKFHPLWYRLLLLALLKGLAQGFLVTAPAMLIMLLLGKEGALGTAQSIGAVIAAIIMYLVGRLSRPEHRVKIFAAGLILFALAALVNGILFDSTGVILFMLFLLVAKPLMDLAYFPIQFKVIDIVSRIENRGEFAYILNHEAGLYIGRFLGAGTFLALAYGISTEIALRYAIIIIGVLQLYSIVLSRRIIREGEVISKAGLRKLVVLTSFCILLSSALLPGKANAQTLQRHLSRVDQMADIPHPLQIIDYRKLALRFDSTVYDFQAKGPFWPLVWWDSSYRNFHQPVVGLYTAMGDVRQGPANNKGMFHEALASMGAVLGATLVGIDKSHQDGLDYVHMLKNYFNRETGWNIMMNNTCPEVALLGGGYGRDWWYDVYPNVLFYAICDKYPQEEGFESIARSIAEKFCQADSILDGNYDYSFFDYGKMKPMKTAICAQPDVAAGHAWVLYSAYKKFGDARYLRHALSAMASLQSRTINPTYEVLMPFGAYMAARLNAERSDSFQLAKMLEWSFDGTAICREGWGVLVGNWNGMDISGIVGSTVDHGGYGFLMNTYDAALPLIPMVRYDQSYASAIGKWILNAANAARLFYPDHMPAVHQTIPQLAAFTKGVIGYEGMIKQSSYPAHQDLKGPVAQGDGPLWVPGKNPEQSQFSVYGSGHAGIFGSIIASTEVPGILRCDLLATDFYHDPAYPTWLYYNPYKESRTIRIEISSGPVDLYDAVTGKFVARRAVHSAEIGLRPMSAAVIVCIPTGGKISHQGNKLLVNGVVIDYHQSR